MKKGRTVQKAGTPLPFAGLPCTADAAVQPEFSNITASAEWRFLFMKAKVKKGIIIVALGLLTMQAFSAVTASFQAEQTDLMLCSDKEFYPLNG